MTRPIKFRILSKFPPDDEYLWDYFDLPTDLGMDGDRYLNSDNFKLETIGQFTGLTDKNGKEIYEGDIIATIAFSRNARKHKIKYAVVLWDNDFAGFLQECIETKEQTGITQTAMDEEVIGNIYENPELLK